MTSVREGNAIAKKQLAQRDLLWPGFEDWLWHRKANKGFATIPKTMPLVLQIMDGLSNGKPLSSTYLGLWCATWDNSMVNISKPDEMAYAAGFTGQRATYTWLGRVNILRELNFISVKPGKSGPTSHILILNPHYIVRWHYEKKTPGLVEAYFNALLDRAIEIGANDLIGPLPSTPSTPVLSPPPTVEMTSAVDDAI
ncbi:hypothetical protein [Elioraea rosea]|uniref:hypothetical protein n=1 Tax=Elioraea rosea TaxID=2492390 RepID=UPI00194F9218|nr:hypothetical protein [Elioraea rosea]